MDPAHVNILAFVGQIILPGGIWRLGDVELIWCVWSNINYAATANIGY